MNETELKEAIKGQLLNFAGSKAKIARARGVSEAIVGDQFNGQNTKMKLSTLEKTATALGFRLVLDFKLIDSKGNELPDPEPKRVTTGHLDFKRREIFEGDSVQVRAAGNGVAACYLFESGEVLGGNKSKVLVDFGNGDSLAIPPQKLLLK